MPNSARGAWAEREVLTEVDPTDRFIFSKLFSALIGQAEEEMMKVALPGGETGTDGGLLWNHAQHAMVLDMITRSDMVWPRYGTSPGYDQAGIGSDGFQEIFTATMMASL